VPEGVELGAFYDCIECFEGQVDFKSWDGVGFARALRERVFDPGLHAQQLLDDNPMVTRLYTTLSPHEMTLDPMFHVEPGDLTVVDDTAVTSTRWFGCSGAVEMRLAEGNRVVELPQFDQWPDIAPELMPWVERVTEHVLGQAPVVLVDNTLTIDALLNDWNSGISFSRAFSCHDTEGSGADGSGGGCGCRTEGGDGTAFGLGLLTLGAWLRRRRRARA
jgi:MYXO-CTERM domain-containing protein